MKTKSRPTTRRGRAALLAGAIAWLAAGSPAAAQMTTPLCVGAAAPILDAFGRALPGTPGAALGEGALVELLWATNGIFPPGFDGTPDPRNAPVEGGQCAIGHQVAEGSGLEGLFGLAIARPRPASGQLFVRVFDAARREQSLFYADSQVMTISGNAPLVAQIGATTHALDPRDDDGDGLNNAWEQALHAEPEIADTDGDGLTDYEEFLAGTDPADGRSVLALIAVERAGETLNVRWQSVPGRTYQLEAAAAGGDYAPVGDPITAAEPTAARSEAAADAPRLYRVRLAP